MKFWGRNLIGAFADGAVLFPLLSALSMKNGFSGPILLASAGVAYWFAGLNFRVPMSVQPLKSIAIAALAIGASSDEVRLSGAILACLCLALTWVDVDRIADRVPVSLVQMLQFGLGVILILQGLRFSADVGVFVLAAVLLISSYGIGIPLLGVVATIGLFFAVRFTGHVVQAESVSDGTIQTGRVISLVLPQLALTLANSVLGTRDVARRYFGEQAKRVTIRRLLQSIGFGNLISSAVGGLPFCHGSGGVTAHYRGGATHWISNGMIGTVLLILAGVAAFEGNMQLQYQLQYPALLLASLLVTTGVFHLGLAKSTWDTHAGKWKIALVLTPAVMTQNMLWVLIVGVFAEYLMARLKKQRGVAI